MGHVNGQMDGRMVKPTEEWSNRRTDGRMVKRTKEMNGQTHEEWSNGRMDERMVKWAKEINGQMHKEWSIGQKYGQKEERAKEWSGGRTLWIPDLSLPWTILGQPLLILHIARESAGALRLALEWPFISLEITITRD